MTSLNHGRPFDYALRCAAATAQGSPEHLRALVAAASEVELLSEAEAIRAWVAALSCQHEMAQVLIAVGQHKQGTEALRQAVMRGVWCEVDVLRLVNNTEALSSRFLTALNIVASDAASRSSEQQADLLVAAAAEVNVRQEADALSPWVCALANHEEMARVISAIPLKQRDTRISTHSLRKAVVEGLPGMDAVMKLVKPASRKRNRASTVVTPATAHTLASFDAVSLSSDEDQQQCYEWL